MREERGPALLARLIAAWRSAHPERASGGYNALAGFGFQFDLALRQMLNDWQQLEPADRGSQPTFVEQLSDIVSDAMDDALIVQQVKLTQSPPNIRKGLADLFSIYLVAVDLEPDQVDQIRFILSFRSGDAEAARPTVEAWADKDPAARAAFAAAVEIGVHPDPGSEVIDMLGNMFGAEHPVRLHDQWIGDLVSAAGYPVPEERPAELRAVARSIWKQLEDLQHASGHRGGLYLLTPEDRPPDTPSKGGVLTGQQPTIDHLRRGFFASRPKVTDRLSSRFRSWLEERDPTDDTQAVRVFWVGGRSGSGKSIALVQLLASLRQDGWDPILWLADKSRLLPEAARWIRDSFDPQGPPLIAVDDPYAPALLRNETWDSFLAELNDGVQGIGASRALPILLCCGPTEQAEMLERDFPDALEVEVVELEREQPEDLELLRSWYGERTGSAPPSDVDQNMLLVQLFFEWRTGRPLRSFAKRFRRRIEAADEDGAVMPLLAEVLAVNRLYVGFPLPEAERRLTDKEADLLDRLQREEHIRIADDGVRDGLWLAHPHLANGIYEAWFPPESSQRERQGHFKEAALASLRTGATQAERVAPIQAVALGLTTSVATIRDRIDAGVVDVLPALYDESLEMLEGRPPIEELALWIEVQMSVGAEFDPDPVNEALLLMTPQACRLPATGRLCEMLLSRIDRLPDRQQEDLVNIVLHLLEKVPGWSSWSRVASAAVEVRPSERLSRLVTSRIQGPVRLESVGKVLSATIRNARNDAPGLRAQALRLLSSQPGRRNWSRTWGALWKERPDDGLRRMGLEFLGEYRRDLSWAYVWSALWDSVKSVSEDTLSPIPQELRKQLPPLGREWLAEVTDQNGWGIVWDKLWDLEPSGDLAVLGRRWVIRGEATPQFNLVWSKLWESGHQDATLRDAGIEALNRIDIDQPAWGYAFLALFEADPTPELRAIGLRWARMASPNGSGWGYVLPALWRVASRENDRTLLDELEQAALNFLQKASPQHGGWSYVFASFQEREAIDALRTRGQGWLAVVSPSQVGWARTWRKLLSPTAPRTAAEVEANETHLTLGEEWLLGDSKQNPGWGYVFLALWPRRPSETLRSEARAWLRNSPLAWDMVWQVLWLGADRHGDQLELRRRALKWLRLNHEDKVWPMVWRALWDEGPDAELAVAGTAWITGAGRRHPRRRYITERIDVGDGSWIPRGESWIASVHTLVRKLSTYPSDFAVCEAVETLLAGVPDGEYQRPMAWKELWEPVWQRIRTRELRAVALTWLELPLPAGPNGRSYVWKSLWRDGPTTTLFEIGCDYLSSAPPTRSLWASMWFELWRFSPSERLRAMGTSWIQSNPADDRDVLAMSELLRSYAGRSRPSQPL